MKSESLQDKLSRFLIRYCNTPRGITNATSLLGQKMQSPLDAIHPDLKREVEPSLMST